MSEQKKHHYRAVYKSDHLGVADIEDLKDSGSDLIFTIQQVKQEYGVRVAGKKGDFNIAYFKEPGMKPWVLNAGNSSILKDLCNAGVNVEDWPPTMVQLYIDPTAQYGGAVTGGVRINPRIVKREKKHLNPNNKTAWTNAKAAYVRDGNLDKVLERMQVSDEYKALIKTEVEAEKNA